MFNIFCTYNLALTTLWPFPVLKGFRIQMSVIVAGNVGKSLVHQLSALAQFRCDRSADKKNISTYSDILGTWKPNYVAFSCKSYTKVLSCGEQTVLFLWTLASCLYGILEDSSWIMSAKSQTRWISVKFFESKAHYLAFSC